MTNMKFSTKWPQDGTAASLDSHAKLHPERQKSHFAYLESVWSVCGIMHLITTSEVESVDERIHTLADRRMVISLMNGAFDRDLNGLLCWFSCVCINSVPFKIYNVLIIHREMHLRFASECRRAWHNVRHCLFARLSLASRKTLMTEIHTSKFRKFQITILMLSPSTSA